MSDAPFLIEPEFKVLLGPVTGAFHGSLSSIATKTSRQLHEVYKEAFEQVYLTDEFIGSYIKWLSKACEVPLEVASLEISTGATLSIDQHPHLKDLMNKPEDKYVTICSLDFRRDSFGKGQFEALLGKLETEDGPQILKPFCALLGKGWKLDWVGYWTEFPSGSRLEFISK